MPEAKNQPVVGPGIQPLIDQHDRCIGPQVVIDGPQQPVVAPHLALDEQPRQAPFDGPTMPLKRTPEPRAPREAHSDTADTGESNSLLR